jgi:acetoin utilization protein AcuB
MFAGSLISTEIFPLKKTDTCETAAVFMQDWNVTHLPVVENNKPVGYVTLEEIVAHSKSTRITSLVRSDKQFAVTINMHLFEVLKVMDEAQLSTLAVLGSESAFSGVISYREVIRDLYRESTLSQPGGILTIEMSGRDYSLAELSRIVEYNDVKIINVFINTKAGETNNVLVSLKFNTSDLKNVISSLERHGKVIRSAHQAIEPGDSFSNRYDWLIKYLNT